MRMTAEEIYDNIITEYTEYWMLIAIVDVAEACKDKNFSKKYAEKIKMKYLKYFGELEVSMDEKFLDDDVKRAIEYFFNSLSTNTEETRNAKINYLKSILMGITIRYFGIDNPAYYGKGTNYIKARDKWINEWIEIFIDCGLDDNLNLDFIRNDFTEDFGIIVKQWKKENVIFDADEELYKQYIKDLMS